MYNLKIETDLNLPHEQKDSALNKLIRGSIKRKSGLPETGAEPSIPLWDSQQYFLPRSSLYLSLTDHAQSRVLKTCNDLLMSDFYFLEKSGLAYCAKMILLAQTTEERQLYGLIACDEATHLEWFTPYVPLELRTHPQSKLMNVLGKIIEDCDPNSLYYLVQTIIEGWGASLYTALAKTCQLETLKSLLRKILRDEMLHHKAGGALFQVQKVYSISAALIFEKLKAYTEVLRVGPQMVIQAFEKECGELDNKRLEKLFSELRSMSVSMVKLNLLKQLMEQPGMGHFVQQLIDEGYMRPYSPEKCAKIYQQMRHQPDMF